MPSSIKLSYAFLVLLARAPRGPLRPFVQRVWVSDAEASSAVSAAGREHVLPTGSMHIVLRLDDEPVRLWSQGGHELELGIAVIGGIRSSYYVKDARPARTIGAQLHAAASLPLLGIPAGELAERHTRLDDVWGAATATLRARLQEAPTPEAALACFEAALSARLPRLRAVHPAIAHALACFDGLAGASLHGHPKPRDPVGHVVADTGLSHRRFLTLFEQAVGLTPKRYCRVLRFQHAIAGVMAGEPLGAVAIDAGYSDQAHLTREFQALAGVSPGAYRDISPERDHHVPVDAGSDFFKTARRARPKLGP
jgi:AraC-like DNA-binding protein